MKLDTEFGYLKIISNNIVEVVINQGLEVTIEMVEAYEKLMAENFNDDYGVLINRINDYSYSFEALLCMGSAEKLTAAAAVITYTPNSEQQNKYLQTVQQLDQVNVKFFPGLEMGRQSAIDWLEEVLVSAKQMK